MWIKKRLTPLSAIEKNMQCIGCDEEIKKPVKNQNYKICAWCKNPAHYDGCMSTIDHVEHGKVLLCSGCTEYPELED